MPSYWDRFAKTYTGIGDADFWLKHRLRLIEGLSGRVLEVCCGGGRLVLEMLKKNIDAIIISTGAIGLFKAPMQVKAIQEIARVARHEIRLLEPFEKKKGLYGGRILAFMFDGMRPIPPSTFQELSLDFQVEQDVLGGAFSYIRCVKR